MEKRSDTIVRWGIVGLGAVVADHVAPAILKSPGSRLMGCAGRTLEKTRSFAGQFGVERVYPSHEDLARDRDIDAIYIATPNALHHAAVMTAARAGKHVLCEKPLALCVADGREMVEACRAAGVILRVAHQIRLERILQRVREIVASGTLGELRSIAFERTAPVGPKSAWRIDPRQGGILYDVAVHLLDLVPWLTGLRFHEVFALSQPDRREGVSDETLAILAQLDAGCHAVIRASREIPFAENDLLIEGTAGTLSTSALRWAEEYTLRIKSASGLVEEHFAATPTYRREIEAFEDEIRGGRSLLPSGEEGVRTIEIATAVLESIHSRRAVAV